MSVRNSLLVILTIGPAYGFQLHSELASRTAGRRTVNVGQIYGTLERLSRHGAIESAGKTPDGLPLYQLTEVGRTEASTWLHDTHSAIGDEWNDLVDRVLLASSLPGFDALGIIRQYRTHWENVGENAWASGQERLAAAAEQALADAALSWLDEAESLLVGTVGSEFQREFTAARPRKGRRPATAG